MMKGLIGKLGMLAVFAVPISLVTPAHAIHLFPLTPVLDPLGHDCAKDLETDPGTSAADVTVVGFNFIDQTALSSTSTVGAGDSVTWKWALDHCHSVTFDDPDVEGTDGAPGFMPAQPQLVRMNGMGNDAFSLTFTEAGTYTYFCVHHVSVGMMGTVVVTP